MSLFTGAAALGAALAAGGAGVAAAKINSGTAQNSANIQSAAAQEALDFAKAQKAKQEAAWAPYAALSANAASQLPAYSRGQSGPPPPTMGQPYQPPQGSTMMNMGTMQPPMPMAGGGQGMPPQTPQGGQMVTLQAPDGTQKAVPASQAQFYIQRGAKQV